MSLSVCVCVCVCACVSLSVCVCWGSESVFADGDTVSCDPWLFFHICPVLLFFIEMHIYFVSKQVFQALILIN